MKPQLDLGSSIKLIVTDFDGILTDGSIYVHEDGTTSKKLNYKDLMGIFQAIKSGINIAIISGDKSKAIDILKEKCPTIDTYQNIRIKIDILKDLVDKYYLTPDEVVYIGDDINDIICLETVKYKVTVPNANWQVKKIPDIQITQNNGGDGAFREVVDSIIFSRIN
ncbi:HAD hydrolase family protein [bacterium]|nr:HAD hydrolase family protein [bacterium]